MINLVCMEPLDTCCTEVEGLTYAVMATRAVEGR